MSINVIQPETHLPKAPTYKIYTALITQASTAAPTATILNNTLGETPTWTRTSAGIYILTINTHYDTLQCYQTIVFCQFNTDDVVMIDNEEDVTHTKIRLTSSHQGTPQDDILYNQPFELRIYT